MNKTIKKVFVVIALLVGIFLAWQLVFNNGGILRTGYNTLANNINGAWNKVGAGNLVALWGTGNPDSTGHAGANTNGNLGSLTTGTGQSNAGNGTGGQ